MFSASLKLRHYGTIQICLLLLLLLHDASIQHVTDKKIILSVNNPPHCNISYSRNSSTGLTKVVGLKQRQLLQIAYTCNLAEGFSYLISLILMAANPSFSSSRLTPRIPRTVYRYFWTFPFFLLFSFSVFYILAVGSVRQIKLTHVSFWPHVKIASRIVSYRIVMWRVEIIEEADK